MSKDQSAVVTSGLGKSPNRILAIALAFLIVLVVIVTLLTSGNDSKSLDPSTPAGTVQGYLTAVLKGNYEKAAEFIAPESSCKVQDLDRVFTMDTTRVDLVKTEIDGNRAQVWVTVDYPSGAPFDAVTVEDHTYRLVKANGQWLLAGIPWPLYDCGVRTK